MSCKVVKWDFIVLFFSVLQLRGRLNVRNDKQFSVIKENNFKMRDEITNIKGG